MIDRRCPTLRYLSAVALLLAGLVPGLASAQQTAQEAASGDAADPLDTFSEVVNVNVVNVEVYVTDRNGEPITGLEPSDFEVFEEGEPMAITNFYAVENGVKVAELDAAGKVVEPELVPSVTFNRIEVPERERLKLVVYIDNFNIRPNDRSRVLDQLRGFVRSTLRRGDQVMLITYDRGINIRLPLTSDPFAFSDALRQVEEVRGEAGQYDNMRKRIIDELQRYNDPGRMISAVRPYADTLFFDVRNSIRSLRRLVDYLAGLPGRKAVLHVSSGIPMIAGGELFTALTAKQGFEMQQVQTQLAEYDSTRLFEELGHHANTHGVTFYTLDAAGLRTRTTGAAEYAGFADGRMSNAIDSELESNVQAPLRLMADQTGGQAILNRNEVLPALEEIARDFRNYYSLGFQPAHYGSGRYYDISVKVRGRGYRVRHREGYRDQSNAEGMIDSTRAALRHDFAQNPLGIQIGVGEGRRHQQQNQFMVPIQVQIPMRDIVLLPQGDAWHARVRLYLAVMDENGDLSEVQETPLGLKIPADAVEQARGERWLYNHQLLVRRGRQKLAIGVRDELGAQESFVTRPFEAGT